VAAAFSRDFSLIVEVVQVVEIDTIPQSEIFFSLFSL
jgi:hypothetical protein